MKKITLPKKNDVLKKIKTVAVIACGATILMTMSGCTSALTSGLGAVRDGIALVDDGIKNTVEIVSKGTDKAVEGALDAAAEGPGGWQKLNTPNGQVTGQRPPTKTL